VHNRVKTIEEKTQHLRELMPDVTFEIAHGQMDEQELEQIMKDFYDMQFEVIVTTTIIESGLDIPNVNTIVIERADRFGLSQLYQLRGRVGRSNSLLKDLELRGAGNILGREQHGDMLAVGFEMYVKLLDEAIRELKEGEAAEAELDSVLDVKYRGYIPERYIESEKLRIEVYKRLAGVRSRGELEELKEEMGDRFGRIPEELGELFNVVKLKVFCRHVGIRMLREKENELQLTFEKSKVDILTLITKIHKNRRLFSIPPRDLNTLHIHRTFESSLEKYEFLKELFDYEEDT
jgi:transcription-repair coupling factor (superfamily II helicase)